MDSQSRSKYSVTGKYVPVPLLQAVNGYRFGALELEVIGPLRMIVGDHLDTLATSDVIDGHD